MPTMSVMTSLGERARPLKRVEYDRLVELGAFGQEKLELIRGTIVHMSPQGVRHAFSIQELTHFFVLTLVASGRAVVRVQLPFAIGDHSEPEPDLAVVPPIDYEDAHPARAFLIAEVADSSLQFDRTEKAALYASADVPEYWVLDVTHGLIEVYTDIIDGAFTRVTPYRPGQEITLVAFPDVRVPVSKLLKG
jgi:Uma2 family endonuclease